MVTKVIIKNNEKSPLNYLPDLDNFSNGSEFEFKPGVNIIVGENGCGKTTLMNLIKQYLLVDYTECGKGAYNSNIRRLLKNGIDGDILDGVDVYADYTKNTFRLSHAGEKESGQAIESFTEFGAMFEQKHSSTGESVLVSLNFLFNHMFSKDAKLMFDYGELEKTYPQYIQYINEHKVDCDNEWTILMDEPDRNLSLKNIEQIKNILSFHKENTQIIAVIHNPLLIYALSDVDHINWIQMSHAYIREIKQQIRRILR